MCVCQNVCVCVCACRRVCAWAMNKSRQDVQCVHTELIIHIYI